MCLVYTIYTKDFLITTISLVGQTKVMYIYHIYHIYHITELKNMEWN